MQIRQATVEDGEFFIRVFELASRGLAPYCWQKTAGKNGDPKDVAKKSMREKLMKAEPNTALTAEVNGEVAGGIITYRIGTAAEVIPSDCDPVIVPLIELENRALNTHYINAVAVFPEFQGQGIGTALLGQIAANARPLNLSLIVEDENTDARRLYEREGFIANISTPIIKGGWETTAKSYILMTRDAA
jgi:ribosomal protein S18 acetylase RimI-like enzyme